MAAAVRNATDRHADETHEHISTCDVGVVVAVGRTRYARARTRSERPANSSLTAWNRDRSSDCQVRSPATVSGSSCLRARTFGASLTYARVLPSGARWSVTIAWPRYRRGLLRPAGAHDSGGLRQAGFRRGHDQGTLVGSPRTTRRPSYDRSFRHCRGRRSEAQKEVLVALGSLASCNGTRRSRRTRCR